MTQPNHMIFDRKRVKAHEARALKTREDFLLREMAERVGDRLGDMARHFPRALDIGSQGLVAEYIPASAGVSELVRFEGDEELVAVEAGSFDLVVACGTLHWVNDLPGTLVQIQRALKPDGLFLGILPGGETLAELRASFEAAELQLSGGLSPRVSPFVDIRDAGGLLQRAGFALPVADSERLVVEYTSPFKLMHDLRAMGQANAMLESRKQFSSRTLMMRMAEYYANHFPAMDGRVRATFEFVMLTGWKPHGSQQKPARRGSGKVSLSVIGD